MKFNGTWPTFSSWLFSRALDLSLLFHFLSFCKSYFFGVHHWLGLKVVNNFNQFTCLTKKKQTLKWQDISIMQLLSFLGRKDDLTIHVKVTTDITFQIPWIFPEFSLIKIKFLRPNKYKMPPFTAIHATLYSHPCHPCIKNDKFSANFPSTLRKALLGSQWPQMFLTALNDIKAVVSSYFCQFFLIFLQKVIFPWLKTKFPDFSLVRTRLKNYFPLTIFPTCHNPACVACICLLFTITETIYNKLNSEHQE